MVSVEGEDLREKTVAILEEVKSSDQGIGGKTHRHASRVLGYYRRGKGMLLYRVCWEESKQWKVTVSAPPFILRAGIK